MKAALWILHSMIYYQVNCAVIVVIVNLVLPQNNNHLLILSIFSHWYGIVSYTKSKCIQNTETYPKIGLAMQTTTYMNLFDIWGKWGGGG